MRVMALALVCERFLEMPKSPSLSRLPLFMLKMFSLFKSRWRILRSWRCFSARQIWSLCLCVCVFVCLVFVYLCICVFVCVLVCVLVCVFVCAFCVYFVFICLFVHLCICVFVCANLHHPVDDLVFGDGAPCILDALGEVWPVTVLHHDVELALAAVAPVDMV